MKSKWPAWALIFLILSSVPAFCAQERQVYTTESILALWAHHHHKPDVFAAGAVPVPSVAMFEDDIKKLKLTGEAVKAEGIGIVEEIAALYAPRLVDHNEKYKELPLDQKGGIFNLRTKNLITGIITARFAGKLKLATPEQIQNPFILSPPEKD